MTTAMATRPGLPGRLREDGYDLPVGLPFERWLEIGQTLQQMERSVQWWLGDWWNYGDRHYGEMASQAAKDHVQDATGYAYSTINKAGWVARQFEDIRRRTDIPWSHHAEVAALPPEKQDALLEKASERGMTRWEVRQAAKIEAEHLRGRSVLADGTCLADAEPLVWVPQIDEVKPDVRATIEAAAPQGRHRLGWIAGAIWSLVWAEQRDAFLEWKA